MAIMNEFIKTYAKAKGLTETEVALIAGAFGYKSIEKSDLYKDFVMTLNQVAPQLIQLNEVLSHE